MIILTAVAAAVACTACNQTDSSGAEKPNIILVMSDDQGYGQVGYYGHPVLETPHLDSMAENGLRLDRFYAGAPVCSPTRASVLTGRASDRTAVFGHGMPMRVQEKTIAEALKKRGYHTAHFGKWHLNGLRGPGVPVFKEDSRNPGAFGFGEWVSVTNYFDMNPLMSDNGEIREYEGSSSDVIVDLAIEYISEHQEGPFFVVIWYGSPHKPWTATEQDRNRLPGSLSKRDQHYLGEIVEIDRTVGRLRSALREMELEEQTLVWFNSDNGGLPEGGKEGVGGLRGFKRSIYEGGLRVPCVIEWPGHIDGGMVSSYPASTMDIFPTIAGILDLPGNCMTRPVDGRSILPLFTGDPGRRSHPIPFKFHNEGALIDNDFKLVVKDIEQKQYALYNLVDDPVEARDLLEVHPEKAREMISFYEKWLKTVIHSVEGKDYHGGLLEPDPNDAFWWNTPAYEPYLEQWKERPEYRRVLKRAGKLED